MTPSKVIEWIVFDPDDSRTSLSVMPFSSEALIAVGSNLPNAAPTVGSNIPDVGDAANATAVGDLNPGHHPTVGKGKPAVSASGNPVHEAGQAEDDESSNPVHAAEDRKQKKKKKRNKEKKKKKRKKKDAKRPVDATVGELDCAVGGEIIGVDAEADAPVEETNAVSGAIDEVDAPAGSTDKADKGDDKAEATSPADKVDEEEANAEGNGPSDMVDTEEADAKDTCPTDMVDAEEVEAKATGPKENKVDAEEVEAEATGRTDSFDADDTGEESAEEDSVKEDCRSHQESVDMDTEDDYSVIMEDQYDAGEGLNGEMSQNKSDEEGSEFIEEEGSEVNKEANGSPLKSKQEEQKWPCPRCSFLNNPRDYTCQSCFKWQRPSDRNVKPPIPYVDLTLADTPQKSEKSSSEKSQSPFKKSTPKKNPPKQSPKKKTPVKKRTRRSPVAKQKKPKKKKNICDNCVTCQDWHKVCEVLEGHLACTLCEKLGVECLFRLSGQGRKDLSTSTPSPRSELKHRSRKRIEEVFWLHLRFISFRTIHTYFLTADAFSSCEGNFWTLTLKTFILIPT